MAKRKQTSSIRVSKEPQLREISFEGNMPSTYEKDLRKALARGPKKRR